jgi:predicted nucleotidyltransferase
MSRAIDVGRLTEKLGAEPVIRFALLFGSASSGHLPTDRSDIDIALYLDHEPDLDERLRLIGVAQDAVACDDVDVVFLNVVRDPILRRETLKGRWLFCRDLDLYAEFFSLADRQGRDEEERIRRAWVLRSELASNRLQVQTEGRLMTDIARMIQHSFVPASTSASAISGIR